MDAGAITQYNPVAMRSYLDEEASRDRGRRMLGVMLAGLVVGLLGGGLAGALTGRGWLMIAGPAGGLVLGAAGGVILKGLMLRDHTKLRAVLEKKRDEMSEADKVLIGKIFYNAVERENGKTRLKGLAVYE